MAFIMFGSADAFFAKEIALRGKPSHPSSKPFASSPRESLTMQDMSAFNRTRACYSKHHSFSSEALETMPTSRSGHPPETSSYASSSSIVYCVEYA